VDNNIRWFFICSTVAATTSLLCLIITAAALAATQEQRSNQELYRSIYYDQGFIHQQKIQEQPIKINDTKELPSLNLQGPQQTYSNHKEANENAKETTQMPLSSYDSAVINKQGDPSQNIKGNSEQATILGTSDYSRDDFQQNTSEKQTSENEKSKDHQIQNGSASGNIIQNVEKVSIDGIIISTTEVSEDGFYAISKQTEATLEIQDGQVLCEYPGNGERHNCGIVQNDSQTNPEGIPGTDLRNESRNESTYIMRITNIKTNTTNNSFIKSLSNRDLKLGSPTISPDHYQEKDLLDNNDGHQKIIITENENTYPLIFNNDETQDIMTIPSIKYESQDENVSEVINNPDDSNKELSKFLSSKVRLEQQESPPQYENLPRSSREVRTVVAINILVASALELAWSLLSASIAWKGMKNCYPHENVSNNCERTIEGLERSLPSPQPPSNDTYTSNKGQRKTDGMFRKPDIISNHRHYHRGNSVHFNAEQNKNGINKLNVINTVSERINTEPYLPMEESTMEYQERVHRFLASNNVANNTCDSAT
jgi:hypothetical protein